MPLRYEDLDEITRPCILSEIEDAARDGRIYISSYLTEDGKSKWTSLLLEAGRAHSDGWLANQLQRNNLILEYTERRKPKGGYTTVKVPYTAADTMAEGEFNRFFCQGLCLRAINEGIQYLEVYRAKEVENPRPDSEQKIGMLVDPRQILEDLRTSPGLEPALGVPPGPNSGLSLRIPKNR